MVNWKLLDQVTNWKTGREHGSPLSVDRSPIKPVGPSNQNPTGQTTSGIN